VVVSLGSSVWVCDCDYHRIIEFNPQTDAVTRTLTFPQAGFLVGLQDTGGATTLWLFDGQAETLTPIDDKTGQLGDSIGVGRNLHGATVAFGALWITAGDRVLRVDGKGPAIAATITMPKGFSAGSMAADPVTKSLWVADCGCPIQ
jgi:DNA-binding beta-propeller fold protein YncE